MTSPLNGRRALVTGSSRGIGFTVAHGLAAAGAQVVINARTEEAARSAAGRINDELGSPMATPSVFDVTDQDQVVSEVAMLTQTGDIDILVNNAGIQRRGELTELSLEAWREVIETNLTGAFIVGQATGRHMVAKGSGSIINMCSVQSKVVRRTTAPYAASKAALVALTQSMCAEWAPYGVRANGLAPGYFDTELNAALVSDSDFSAWVRDRTPAGRWGMLDELVGPILWLASEDSRFVNGQIIYVDGGMTAVI